EVFDVFGLERGAAEVGGVVDDVVNQTEKAVDKIVPGAGLVREAALQQVAIDRCQGHVRVLDCRLRSADCRLPIADSPTPTSRRRWNSCLPIRNPQWDDDILPSFRPPW